MKTSCKDCLLATWDENNFQDGCKLNRLDKFPNKKRYQNYFIIDRLCNTCRHSKYENRYSDPVSQIRQEVRTQVDLIIFLDQVVEDEIILLTSYVNWLNPQCVKIVCPPEEPYWIAHKNFGKYCKSNFNIIQIFEPMTKEQQIDYVVGHCKNQYYMVVNQNFGIDIKYESYIDQLDRVINDDLQRVLAIPYNQSGNYLTVNTKMHQLLNGNLGESILQKIETFAKEKKHEEWIKTWDQILK